MKIWIHMNRNRLEKKEFQEKDVEAHNHNYHITLGCSAIFTIYSYLMFKDYLNISQEETLQHHTP